MTLQRSTVTSIDIDKAQKNIIRKNAAGKQVCTPVNEKKGKYIFLKAQKKYGLFFLKKFHRSMLNIIYY